MIQMLKIEFLKTKNTRSFVIPFLLFLIGSLWAIAASQLQTINPSDMETLPKIVALFASLNGLFFSIAIGLFTSKISSIEHIGNTFKLLLTSNQNLKELFISKILLSNMFFIFLSLLETFLILAVSSIVKINIGLEMIFYHFLSSIVVSFILIVIQVFLSLRFEKQVIGIGVSLFGAFLSFSLSRLPKFITRLIPWCLYTELSPSRMIGIDGVAHYYEKSGNLNIHLIYICIYLILFFILRNIYGKHNY